LNFLKNYSEQIKPKQDESKSKPENAKNLEKVEINKVNQKKDKPKVKFEADYYRMPPKLGTVALDRLDWDPFF
jgi:hypothetical protein